ncbi:MAG: helix-turn-helix domain-containing protein [Clostridiales bacterium]|nr:helix-turn-helix domain-containing protein [Clostridiales bacterium]
MDIVKVGDLIARRRKELGITQQQLGDVLGVSAKAVSKWERGLSCPDIALLSQLSSQLKIMLKELLDGKLNNKQSSNIGSNVNFSYHNDRMFDLEETVELNACKRVVSPYLFGNNLEHTRSSVYHGISAQILDNRKFAGKPSAMQGVAYRWYTVGKKTYTMLIYDKMTNAIPFAPYVRHDEEHYHMKRDHERNYQQISSANEGEKSGIGQSEIYLQEGKTYDFAIVLRSCKVDKIVVAFTSRKGKEYVKTEISIKPDAQDWERYTAKITAPVTDFDANIEITFEQRGSVAVGAVSLMDEDNFRGMRKDVIARMKEMGIKLLRWPGGNFAGEYNWFDGLLPVDMRSPLETCWALETQPHSQCYDFHEINTDDFIALCKEIGAEPYLTVNLAWNTPEENAMWVEYCNGDENSIWGKKRIERGYKEPYNVILWSLGNEFGFGHMEGENSIHGYTRLAKETAEKMLKVTPNLTFCSSGPYPNAEWVEYSVKPLKSVCSTISVHSYVPGPYYYYVDNIKEEYEIGVSKYLGAWDRAIQTRDLLPNDVSISFDEWNVWYGWYRPSCVVDGICGALTMNMLICESEKLNIQFACHFEAVNESAIKVDRNKAYLTPLGRAISLSALHANGKLVYGSHTSVVTEKNGTYTATLVNPSFDRLKTVTFPKDFVIKEIVGYGSADVFPNSNFEEYSPIVNGENIELREHSIVVIKAVRN